MTNIFSHVAGKTFQSHEKFLAKLTKRGAKVVNSFSKDATVIVFCPIVSRFESDVSAALSKARDLGFEEVILVAMHHTFDKDYVLPSRQMDHTTKPTITLFVECLFFEGKGLFTCPRNKKAIKMVRKKLGLKKGRRGWLRKRKGKAKDKNKERD